MPDAGICCGQRKGRTMQMVQGYIGRRDEETSVFINDLKEMLCLL